MKKIFIFIFLLMAVALQFCSSSKKTSKAAVAKITYASSIQPLIIANCSPCHIPPKGNKKALDTYASASSTIDDMIARMQKNPADKGFMPFKHPKLSDSTINVFVQWKANGMPEK